jgi:hypothetical protein
MSAFKRFQKQDVYVTVHNAQKQWEVPASKFDDYGITAQYISGSIFDKIKYMYYPEKDSTGMMVSHSGDYYAQSSFDIPQRILLSGSYLITIPRDKYGTHLVEPQLLISGNVLNYPPDFVQLNYWQLFYTTAGRFYFNQTGSQKYYEREDGKLLLDTKYRNSNSVFNGYVGDVFYNHGVMVLTDRVYTPAITGSQSFSLKWKSNQPIYTYNYQIKVRESEFNFSQNPTARDSKTGDIKPHLTGSEFRPYITTVGLYNDSNELLGVAKIGQPVMNPKDTDLTIVIRIDV